MNPYLITRFEERPSSEKENSDRRRRMGSRRLFSLAVILAELALGNVLTGIRARGVTPGSHEMGGSISDYKR